MIQITPLPFRVNAHFELDDYRDINSELVEDPFPDSIEDGAEEVISYHWIFEEEDEDEEESPSPLVEEEDFFDELYSIF